MTPNPVLTAIAAFAAAAILSLAAHAAGETAPSAKACNADAMQTNDYVRCLEKALEAAEGDVAAVAKRALAEIAKGDLDAPEKEKTKTLFETAQAEWRKYRDADCAAYARQTAGLGFGALQFRIACHVDETIQRVETLKARYELE